MKALVTLATLVFLAAIAGVNLMAAGQATKPPAVSSAALPDVRAPAQSAGQSAAAPASPAPAPVRYTLAEIARHADAKSCWMAIGGVVYDFTAYLPRHPADPQAMLRHCGKEASEAFRTKDAGRPHSPYAVRLLDTYRIGTLRD